MNTSNLLLYVFDSCKFPQSTQDIGLYLDKLKAKGHEIDMVIVDYIDKLKVTKGDFRLALRDLTEELRYLSIDRNIAVVTATQANRASLAKPKMTEAHISESFGKVEVADTIIALSQTDEERTQKRARLVMLKNRDYVSGGCIESYVDFDKMILMDIDLASKMGMLETLDDVKESSGMDMLIK